MVSAPDLEVLRIWVYERELENTVAGTIGMDRTIRLPSMNLEMTFIPGMN